MKTKSKILLLCLLVTLFLGNLNAQTEKETRYLAFQIFTYGPNPKVATMGEGTNPQLARFPDKAVLRDYIEDIKRRIGAVGDRQTRLAVMLGQLSFDHGDADVTKFIELGFELALETDVAVGFHIDDSMFWAKRKDLWSDPNNVEALDWDGTPNTGRRLNWQTGPGSKADAAPPQMCFNSKTIQREVEQRSALLGKAIQAGVNRLRQLKRPELFAGVIVGSETEIGQDFKTGKYLGYRALLNRGFSRQHPPRDMDLEREKVVQEFIEHWTKGFAEAGVSPQKIYSHIGPFPRRAFKLGGNKEIAYSQHNHFATTSVAFGKYHQPGFSTYPAPGRFDDIYEELAKHNQVGWASCEGTNLELGSGPGQSGMTMETYLAKMFNHGGTLVNIFSWGIGGEANKNMSFRVVTEGEEALQAYRKFLKGDPLVEAKTEAVTLLERFPPKIHKIQEELPVWMQKSGNKDKAAEAAALMQKMQEQLKGRDFEEAEKTADSILKMMGVSPQAAAPSEAKTEASTLMERLPLKIQKIQKELPVWARNAGNKEKATAFMQKLKELLEARNFEEAEKTADSILQTIGVSAQSPADPTEASHPRIDPFAGAFFPPELILLVHDRIALTPEKLEVFRARVEKTQRRSDELRVKLERETGAAAALMKKERVDEGALVAQLDKVLDVASELKHLHVDAGVAIKNLLTPEQQAKLREIAFEIAKNGVRKFEAEAGKRISGKVERVKAGAQQWMESVGTAWQYAVVMEVAECRS